MKNTCTELNGINHIIVDSWIGKKVIKTVSIFEFFTQFGLYIDLLANEDGTFKEIQVRREGGSDGARGGSYYVKLSKSNIDYAINYCKKYIEK